MKHLSMNELHEMTMKAMQAWINECACEINRTMVMSWDHNNLFKGLHVVPDVLGYHAGRIIIEGFHFTSKARKADMIEFVQWLHWAISGEYPAEETENTEEESENAETIEEEEHTMKKFYKVSFEHSAGIYCTNLAHAETIEDVERHYSKYAWQSVKEAQPWDVDEARMKGMPIIEIEHEEPAQDAAEAPETVEETETEEQTTETQETTTEAAEAASEAHTTEEKKEEGNTMKNTNTAAKKGYYNEKTIAKFAEALKAARIAVADMTDTRVRISNSNSKMGNVASVSTLPFITCPACCGSTCGADCYAAKLANLRPSVLKSYAINTAMALLRPVEYWAQVEAAVMAVRYFRFHVSGDILNADYFAHMVEVAQRNPHTEILVFTKRYQIVNAWIDENGSLPENLHILFSGWTNLTPDNPHNLPETNIFTSEADIHDDWKICGGNCFNCACRGVGCWQAQKGDTIAFKKH